MSTTAERYRRFAREAAPRSRTYAAWAEAIAADDECLALIDTLPVADRQPVLVLSAARFSGLSTHGDIRAWLEGEWDAVAQIAQQRATQTNDPRRTTPLLAALQGIHGPVALLEVGASAGLGLLVDRYSHVMIDAEGVEHRVDPVDGPSTLELRCTFGAGVPVPTAMPDIVWRAGLERSPVRLDRADDERWLRTLIWPEERERAAQLDAAIAIAREHPPHLVAGDAVEGLVYLAPADRARFVAAVTELPGHWVSLDGRRVLPEVGEAADALLPGAGDDFVLSRDGRPLAVVSAHGERIERWVGGRA
ncbi:MAG: DUF2332 domain-containing protein [Microbacteriaceae bacterium]|nr:DUF2332 domain-containing protein [Microbacteriaceae bacterium]